MKERSQAAAAALFLRGGDWRSRWRLRRAAKARGENGVDVKIVGGGCGANKEDNPRTNRAGERRRRNFGTRKAADLFNS